jgi:signal transduction histidine kinase
MASRTGIDRRSAAEAAAAVAAGVAWSVARASVAAAAASSAVATERRRLARELHDGLSQELALLSLRATDGIVAETAERALDEARHAIFGLYVGPAQPFDELLRRLVQDLARRWERQAEVVVVHPWDPDVRTQEPILRIVREAMANAFRHGEAASVQVRIDGRLGLLRVVDDGLGFDVASATGGFGLEGMRDRAAALGGHLAVTSTPTVGTVVELVLR